MGTKSTDAMNIYILSQHYLAQKASIELCAVSTSRSYDISLSMAIDTLKRPIDKYLLQIYQLIYKKDTFGWLHLIEFLKANQEMKFWLYAIRLIAREKDVLRTIQLFAEYKRIYIGKEKVEIKEWVVESPRRVAIQNFWEAIELGSMESKIYNGIIEPYYDIKSISAYKRSIITGTSLVMNVPISVRDDQMAALIVELGYKITKGTLTSDTLKEYAESIEFTKTFDLSPKEMRTLAAIRAATAKAIGIYAGAPLDLYRLLLESHEGSLKEMMGSEKGYQTYKSIVQEFLIFNLNLAA